MARRRQTLRKKNELEENAMGESRGHGFTCTNKHTDVVVDLALLGKHAITQYSEN